MDDLKEIQARDRDVKTIMSWVDAKSRPPFSDVASGSHYLKSMWNQFETLDLHDGIFVKNLTPIESTNENTEGHTYGIQTESSRICSRYSICGTLGYEKKHLRKYDSSITGPVYELMCEHILRDVKRVQNEKDQTARNKHRGKSFEVSILWRG
ncbi:hypothetical protein DPMN_067447 [Dreissena polymorpha]|uniref:Uncharacterized protein n=1 Tax=Dreissena polymorpha TaxID=45954 RepID=A0A9D3YV96_DREPO|nr:hypothetical protein DPMN_067447 [Dreissena polymorpha]